MGWAQANGRNFTPMYRVNGAKISCKAKECGTFTTKDTAKAHADRCEAKALAIFAQDREWHEEHPNATADDLSPSQKAQLTFEDAWDRYRSAVGRTIELATLESYACSMRLRVLPRFGSLRPEAISRGQVGTWLSRMKNEGVSAHTVRSTLLAMSAVMTYAIDQEIRLDTRNPCHRQKIDTAVRSKRDDEFELTGDQAQRLVAAFTTPGLRLATLTMLGTGARYEELAALRVGCLVGDTIHIERRVTWPIKNAERGHQGGPIEHRNTKSKGVRKFKIRTHLADQLHQWIADNGLKKGQLLFSHDLVTPSRRGHGYVDDSGVPELTEEFIATLGTLTAPNGFQYRHGTIGAATTGKCRCTYCQVARRRYDRARRVEKGMKASVVRLENPERYLRHETYLARFHQAVADSGLADELDWTPTPHCLRHTYITRLANSGVPLAEVQRRAGHEDIHTTMGYVHPNKAADRAAAEALGTDFDIDLREVG